MPTNRNPIKQADSLSGDEKALSVSELFHENSKQHRFDLEFSRRINWVNKSAQLHRIISRSGKTYAGATKVAFPEIQKDENSAFEQTVLARRSIRRFTGEGLTLQELSRLFYFGNGVTGSLPSLEHQMVQSVRAAPSGGALNPVEMYAVLSNNPSLEDGLYHYQALNHSLEQLAPGVFMPTLEQATSDQKTLSQANMVILLTGVFAKAKFKYGERGYRFTLLEAGHIAQNILLEATALNLGAVAIGGFVDDEVNELLAIDGIDEACLYLLVVGRPDTTETYFSTRGVQGVVSYLLEQMWSPEDR